MPAPVKVTIDFGASPGVSGEQKFTVSDASFAGMTFVEGFFMGTDSTTDNDATSHQMAAKLINVVCDAPSGTNVGVTCQIEDGAQVWGTFKLNIADV